MTDTIAFIEQDALGLQARRDRAKAAFLIHLVSMATEVPPKSIAAPSRANNEAARARWLAIYLMHTSLSVPLMRVAAAFGRDRSSVAQVLHRIEDWRTDPAFDAALMRLERCAGAAPPDAAPEALGMCGRLSAGGREPAA